MSKQVAGHRFGPREQNGIFGLRPAQLGVIAGGALLAILLARVGSLLVGGLLVLGVLAGAAALAFLTFGHRTADQWTIVLAVYSLRNLGGQRRWSSRAHLMGQRLHLAPGSRAVRAVLLPQDLPPGLEGVQILSATVAGERAEVGIVRDGRSYLAVVGVEGPGFALMDPGAQERLAGEWGSIIADFGIANTPVDRIQWLERTVPEDPTALVRYARSKIPELADARTPEELAAALAALPPARYRVVWSYLDGVSRGGPVAQQHESYVVLRLSTARPLVARQLRRAGQGDLQRGACESLLRQAASLSERLQAAGLRVSGMLTPRLLAEAIRVAYDLTARHRGRQLEQAGREEGVDPLRFAPGAVAEFGNHLRTDGSLHATYHVAEWPRREVTATFLYPLLLRTRCTRTVAMTMEPVDPRRAGREIERARVGRQTAGRVLTHYGWEQSFRREAEDEKVETVGQELTEGHVSVRYSAYVTVSAQTPEELEEACGQVETQASQSLLELERLWGQQLPAFTYTLPLARGL
jgi:hypothetical protein